MRNRGTCECEHDFALLLLGVHELTEEIENRLFDGGCDDATLAIRKGQAVLTFTRAAPSLQDAIFRAVRDVRKAGIDVLRVDDCNLVAQADIARRMGRTRSLVNQYIQGTRGPGAFPPPACLIADIKPLWEWCEVAHWLFKHQLISEGKLREAELVAAVNRTLDFIHQQRREPALIDEVFKAVGAPPPQFAATA